MNEQTDGQTDEVGSIASRIFDEAPEPQAHAIEQAAAEMGANVNAETPAPPASEAPAIYGERDDAGEIWNPEVHATGADGKGVKTAKGQWRRRRGVSGSRASVIAASTRTAIPPQNAGENESRAAGVACAHSVFMLGMMLGGDEWKPRRDSDIDEIAMMEKAWGDYFVAKGYKDFPPGMALSLAMIGYAAPRFTMPKTQSRMQKAKEWIAHKYVAWKLRRENKAAPTSELGARRKEP